MSNVLIHGDIYSLFYHLLFDVYIQETIRLKN
jgi:hypothetical protein